jgi:hypothetical protein
MSTQGKERGIRTSDHRFMSRDLHLIELLLGNSTLCLLTVQVKHFALVSVFHVILGG